MMLCAMHNSCRDQGQVGYAPPMTGSSQVFATVFLGGRLIQRPAWGPGIANSQALLLLNQQIKSQGVI